MVPQIFHTTDLLSAGSTTVFLTNIGRVPAVDVTLALPSPMVSTLCSLVLLTVGRPELAAAPNAFYEAACRVQVTVLLGYGSGMGQTNLNLLLD